MSNVNEMSDEQLLGILRARAIDDYKLISVKHLISMFAASSRNSPELTPGLDAAIGLAKLYSRTLKAQNGRHPFADFPASTTVEQILQRASSMIDRRPPKDPPHVATTLRPRDVAVPKRGRFRKTEGGVSKISLVSSRLLGHMNGEFGIADAVSVCSDLPVGKQDINNAIYDLARRGQIFRIGFKTGRYRVARTSVQATG